MRSVSNAFNEASVFFAMTSGFRTPTHWSLLVLDGLSEKR